MFHDPRRATAAFLVLVGVWILVYWWWEPAPAPITFDQTSPTHADPDTRPIPGEATASTPNVPGVPPRPTIGPDQIPGRPREHVVREGETFESIARRYFGSTRYAGAIARANSLRDPTRLNPGDVIFIPRDPANPQAAAPSVTTGPTAHPAPPGPTLYTVRPGDTLSQIAQQVYGSARLSDLIFQANRDRLRSPDAVRVGQILRIPPRPSEPTGGS